MSHPPISTHSPSFYHFNIPVILVEEGYLWVLFLCDNFLWLSLTYPKICLHIREILEKSWQFWTSWKQNCHISEVNRRKLDWLQFNTSLTLQGRVSFCVRDLSMWQHPQNDMILTVSLHIKFWRSFSTKIADSSWYVTNRTRWRSHWIFKLLFTDGSLSLKMLFSHTSSRMRARIDIICII